MSSNVQPAPNPPPLAPGLPPVQPPTGKHIVRMFLVPGLIVGTIVLVLIGFVWLFGGPRTPAEFLRKLDDPNEEVRWRTAADLAQVLLRDKDLAGDAEFALQIAIRLEEALEANRTAEERLAERLLSKTDDKARAEEWRRIKTEADWKTLQGRRDYIMYLTACTANFSVPVGVPLLRKMAEQDSGMEPRGLAQRRWGALWALAVHGQKLAKEYPSLPDLKKDHIRQQLEQALERKDHVAWVQPALDDLNRRRDDKPDTVGVLGVDRTAARCVGSGSDPFMRQLVALCLNFWIGTKEENDRIDLILVDLTKDAGAGGDLLAELIAENPGGFGPAGEVTSLEIQFQAHRALANRGSRKADVKMLAKLLDEDFLREHLKVREKNAEPRTSEGAVTQTLIDTLKAVGSLYRKQPDMVDAPLKDAVKKLTDDANKAVATEAKNLQKTFAE